MSVFALAAAAVLPPSAACAQEAALVRGVVTDSLGVPVVRARVTARGSVAEEFSGGDGRFELRLSSGEWVVTARRVGFRPDSARVVVRRGGPPPALRLVLRPLPAELRGVVITGAAGRPLASTLTRESVRQAPPLVEPDVMRALPFLADVSQANDLDAGLNLAGSRQDETRVQLDGFPLQAPMHLSGLLSSLNLAALDRAEVLIHRVPPEVGDATGGVVELTSRATDATAREGVVSLLSASATAAVPALPGGVAAMGSGRVTYLDKVIGRLDTGGGERLDAPSYRDGMLAAERDWGAWHVRGLAYLAADAQGEGALTWGERLLGVAASYRRGAWQGEVRGFGNAAVVDHRASGEPVDVDRGWRGASARIRWTRARAELSAGASVDARDFSYAWSAPSVARVAFGAAAPLEFQGEQRQTLAALHADARVAAGPWAVVTLGGRAARAAREGGAITAEPRALVTLGRPERLELSVAAERRAQYHAEAGRSSEGDAMPPVFLFDRPETVDALAGVAAVERRPFGQASRFRLEASAFARAYRDRPLATYRGRTSTTGGTEGPYPGFTRVDARSRGASGSAALLLPRGAALQARYSFVRAWETVDGREGRAAWDVPHVAAAFGSVPAWRGWTVTAAVQAHSGPVATPVAAVKYLLSPTGIGLLTSRALLGDENSARLPAYVRADIGARHAWRVWGAEWVGSIQVLNVTGRQNPLAYDATTLVQSGGVFVPAVVDRSGMPLVPSLGLEVRW